MDASKFVKAKFHAVQAAVSVVAKPVAEKVMAIKPVAAVTHKVVEWSDAHPGAARSLKVGALGVAVVAGLPAEVAVAIGTGGIAAPAVIAANFGLISTALASQQVGSQMAVASREQRGVATPSLSPQSRAQGSVARPPQQVAHESSLSQTVDSGLKAGTWYTLPKGGTVGLNNGGETTQLPAGTMVLPLGDVKRGSDRASLSGGSSSTVTDASEANILTPGGSISRVSSADGISITAEDAQEVSAPRLSTDRATPERNTSRVLSRDLGINL